MTSPQTATPPTLPAPAHRIYTDQPGSTFRWRCSECGRGSSTYPRRTEARLAGEDHQRRCHRPYTPPPISGLESCVAARLRPGDRLRASTTFPIYFDCGDGVMTLAVPGEIAEVSAIQTSETGLDLVVEFAGHGWTAAYFADETTRRVSP